MLMAWRERRWQNNLGGGSVSLMAMAKAWRVGYQRRRNRKWRRRRRNGESGGEVISMAYLERNHGSARRQLSVSWHRKWHGYVVANNRRDQPAIAKADLKRLAP